MKRGTEEMKKRHMKRGTALLVLAGFAAVLSTGSAKITAAYLSSRETAVNKAAFADNRIVIEEPDFNPDTKTDFGTTVYPKTVRIKNTGNVPVYARVRIEFSDPLAKECTSFTNSTGTFAASELDSHLPEGWVKSDAGGGYYCYTKALAPNETAPDLIRTAATVFREDTGRTDYEIYVRAESIQTKADAGSGMKELYWEEAWNRNAKNEEAEL